MTSNKQELSWNEIKHLSVKEFFMFIKLDSLLKIGQILLMALALFPVVALLLRAFEPAIIINSDYYFKLYLQIIGFQCLLLGLVINIWRHFNCFKADTSLYDYILKNGLWIFLLLMLLWSFIAVVFSNNFLLSFIGNDIREGFLMYLAYAGIFSVACNLNDKHRIITIAKCLVISTSLLAILSILDTPRINVLFKFTSYTSIFRNQNHYAYLLSIVVILAWGIFIDTYHKKDYKVTIFYGILLTLLTQAIIISKTLGGLLACLVTVTICSIILMVLKKHQLKPIVMATLIFILAIGFQSSKNWNLYDEFNRLNQDLKTLNTSIQTQDFETQQFDRIGSSRGILLKHAILFIIEKPIFGHGPDNLQQRYIQNGITFETSPHNEFIHYAAALGIPALIFYIIALFSHLLLFIKYHRNVSILTWILYSGVLSYLISSLFGNTKIYTTPFFFLILALSYASIMINIKNEAH